MTVSLNKMQMNKIVLLALINSVQYGEWVC